MPKAQHQSKVEYNYFSGFSTIIPCDPTFSTHIEYYVVYNLLHVHFIMGRHSYLKCKM